MSNLLHKGTSSAMASTSTGCPRWLELADLSAKVDGSHHSELNYTAEQTLSLDAASSEIVVVERLDGTERAWAAVELQIERSKSHWSELSKSERSLADSCDEEDVEAQNVEVFKTLQYHPIWCRFFKTFGYDFGRRHSAGELEVGGKFAEGGQAELFHAYVTWRNEKYNEYHLRKGTKWALKVFKKGTSLLCLQQQWPQGMLQFEAQKYDNGFIPYTRLTLELYCGTLLEDGRFAFLMKKEDEDLRSLINNVRRFTKDYCGPFSRKMSLRLMLRIACGIGWLHSHNIIHRDLKTSNVLISRSKGGWACYIIDYECSIGVVGTGFWRAPEILQACEDQNIRMELFTKASDIYSYGMMCYEILTGLVPFEDHTNIRNGCVIGGQRPMIPQYVDARVHKFLCKCWEFEPFNRPSFNEIVEELKELLKPYRGEVDSGSDESDYV